jgi:hypothetical protein
MGTGAVATDGEILRLIKTRAGRSHWLTDGCAGVMMGDDLREI